MSVTVAMIPLAPKAKVGPAGVRKAFAALWPHLPAPTSAGDAKAGSVVLDVGEFGSVIAQVVPAPIPAGDVEHAVANTWLWPHDRAAEDMAGHRGHIIVTTFGPEDPIERATLLTCGIAAVLESCPQALGVYWGDAGMLVGAGVFKDMAARMLPDALPVYLWVNMRVGTGPTGKTAGATTGLAALGHKEFETENCPDRPGDLRERLSAIADYVLTNGPVIRDGNTIGSDATAEIKVRYAPSAFGADGDVMRLEWVATKKRR